MATWLAHLFQLIKWERPEHKKSLKNLGSHFGLKSVRLWTTCTYYRARKNHQQNLTFIDHSFSPANLNSRLRPLHICNTRRVCLCARKSRVKEANRVNNLWNNANCSVTCSIQHCCCFVASRGLRSITGSNDDYEAYEGRQIRTKNGGSSASWHCYIWR